jgi:hypothetical protein
MHRLIVEKFSSNIRNRVKGGYLSSDWVTDGYWIDQRWLHGTFWGALVSAGPENSMPIIEPTIMRGFRPDLVFINSNHEKIAVIEYESANSSDERLVLKDLRHFREAILEYKERKEHSDDPGWVVPKMWMIISTLPSCSVVRWPWHGYNNSMHAGPKIKDRRKRDESPLEYYEESLHAAFSSVWTEVSAGLPIKKGDDINLVWVNIDQTHARVKNFNGQACSGEDLDYKLFNF